METKYGNPCKILKKKLLDDSLLKKCCTEECNISLIKKYSCNSKFGFGTYNFYLSKTTPINHHHLYFEDFENSKIPFPKETRKHLRRLLRHKHPKKYFKKLQ